MTADIWYTGTSAYPTPRGLRWSGICYTGSPNRAKEITYRTRLLKSANEAQEQARERTIHHNLWHDGSGFTKHHLARYCHERAA